VNEPREHPHAEPLTANGLLALRRVMAVRQAERALLEAEQATPIDDTERADPGAPTGLAVRMLDRALAARPAGRPAGPWASDGIDPLEALVQTQADLAHLLDELTPGDWDRPVAIESTTGWTVRDVVAHLVAVETYHRATLGHGSWEPPPGTEAFHAAMTEPTVRALRSLPIGELRARWDEAVAASLDACRTEAAKPGRLGQRVNFTAIPFRVGTLMVLRAFEVWTHDDDIRRAVGRPLDAPDGARLALMSDLAVNAVPLGLLMTGRSSASRTARIVLTGPGGGAWSQAMAVGETPGPPDVVIVADVVDFCRVAARRMPADDLVCHVEGDHLLAADVLAGVAVFAA